MSLYYKERKDGFSFLIGGIVICLLVLSIYHILENGIYWDAMENKIFISILETFDFLFEWVIIVRFAILVILYFAAVYLPRYKKREESQSQILAFRILGGITSIVFLTGYRGIQWYDLYVYPTVFCLMLVFLPLAAMTLNRPSKEVSFFSKLNKLTEGLISYSLDTDQGLLNINKAEEGISIEGGTGSGKTVLTQELVWQSCTKGMGGLIYEYEGDLQDANEKEKPFVLARTAYTALKYNNTNVRWALINFNDITRTHQCNPLDVKYIDKKTKALQICTVLMKSLEKHWISKTDFWAKNAIHYIQAIYWMMNKHTPEICTLPHMVAIGLQNHNIVLKWLLTDDEIERIIRPMISAIQESANQQVAGQISTGQLPLVILDNQEVFYGMCKDEVNLDLTNKENPTLLCIGNVPAMSEAFSPVISVILGVVKNNINRFGRIKAMFFIDELSTVFVYKLDEFVNMVRKKGGVVLVTFQMFEQIILNYGREVAQNIRKGLQNMFIGKTSDNDSAKTFVEILGDNDKVKYSYSTSSSSESKSESTQKEKILQTRDITGQPTGHFTGKISGGIPPFFHVQMKNYSENLPELLDIPLFSRKYEMDNKDLENEMNDNYLKANYDRIYDEVEQLLQPYREEYQNELKRAKEAMEFAYKSRPKRESAD